MKTILVSFCFLLISTVAFSQYATCALAGASPVTIDMSTTCGSWTSNTFNLFTQGTTTTTFPAGDCAAGSPNRDYWVSFIMPSNTTPKFSIEFEIVGGCTSADLSALGVTYIVNSCTGTNATRGTMCGFCDATDCNNKKVASNSAFTPGAQIYLQIYDNNSTNCNIKMHLYPSPSEDDCSTAKPFDPTKSYCNKGASNKNEVINPPGNCGPSPNKNGIHSIDNAMWFSFTVTAADPQPYTLTMDNIACTGGQQSMQMMVYSASCSCTSGTGGMSSCIVACTAQEEPATTTFLTITPGAGNTGNILAPGNYYLVIDGGNGADCVWSLNKNISLPVTLASFDLIKYKSSIKLNWQVLQEENNKGYTIQRSADGHSYKEIDYISGRGNYNGILNYEYIDYEPLKSDNYYRLKQEDFDGKIHYSVVRATTMDAAEVAIYPNPVTENFQLSVSDISEEYRYTVLNTNGQTIAEAKCNDDNFISLSNYPSGLYHILVYNSFGEVVLNQSLVKY